MMNQDGVYDHSKGRGIVSDEPEPNLLRYDFMGPFANAQEANMSRALRSVTIPSQLIPDLVRPPLPNLVLFPPKYGYRTRELGIMDVMDVNEEFQPTRVDFTQNPGGYQGTSRNASEGGGW
jgi:hypothetical protein